MRLRGIGPEVLLLCFLVIGAAAFVLGRRSARARRVRGDTEYFAGLDHLVNDRYDRAAEVFTRLATKSHEAEIQFALGSLMRKRGEVDRAIAIHTELAENRNPAIREQATLALGLDYMSAGLMDRAEEKLRSLLGSERYRAAALEKLAWVYEQQRDWRAALDLWRELPPEKQGERAADAAHYCCELAEAALANGELDTARSQLAAARVHAPDGARTRMLAARIAAASGEEHRRSSCTPRRSRVRPRWRRHSCRRRTRPLGRVPRSWTASCGRNTVPNQMRRSSKRVFDASNVESAVSPGIGAAPAAARGTRCAVSITAAFDEIADCGQGPRHC